MLGPDSPQLDEFHRSGIVTTGPWRHFRQVGSLAGGNYRLWPPPQAVNTPFQIAWEYITLAWAMNLGGTLITKMTADTDVPILDSQAIILGVKWRFMQAKGVSTAASMQTEYLDYVQQLIAQRRRGAHARNGTALSELSGYAVASSRRELARMRATLALEMNRKTANPHMGGTGDSYPMSIPASTKGWDQISSLANMDPDHAVQLDNWIPRPGYLEIRRGSKVKATGIGTGSTAVETIMAYNSPNVTNSKLFAIGGGTIYDVTAGGAAVAILHHRAFQQPLAIYQFHQRKSVRLAGGCEWD